ncbi:MAG TPA: hypothetical protein VN690_02850 [Terriglobales bacterium]|nr:hypothetical protein [Terriglobales bacterium]
MQILALNTGSSSVKLARLEGEQRVWETQAAGLNTAADFTAALRSALPNDAPEAVCHRVVAPLDWAEPRRLDANAKRELRERIALAPDHLPQALAAIEACEQAYPRAAQVACSDSAFHQTMAAEARALPVPGPGLRRYGYHGLACESVVEALRDAGELPERLIVAHLGHGCSVTAVRAGASMDTSMGLTPLGGMVMSNRSGDLDPGVILQLLRQLAPGALDRMLNQESGLIAISGISGDMKELLASRDPRAKLAVDVFVHSARKQVGAMAAALGGCDLLAFSGGIGEHAEQIRERIAAGLPKSRVVAADEERMMARHALTLLG